MHFKPIGIMAFITVADPRIGHQFRGIGCKVYKACRLGGGGSGGACPIHPPDFIGMRLILRPYRCDCKSISHNTPGRDVTDI